MLLALIIGLPGEAPEMFLGFRQNFLDFIVDDPARRIATAIYANETMSARQIAQDRVRLRKVDSIVLIPGQTGEGHFLLQRCPFFRRGDTAIDEFHAKVTEQQAGRFCPATQFEIAEGRRSHHQRTRCSVVSNTSA